MEIKSVVPGLPENLRLGIWEEILKDIIIDRPTYDDELGFIWDPLLYIGPYARDLQRLTFDHITVGLSDEISKKLSTLDSRELKESYLKSLERPEDLYTDIHTIRWEAEKRLSILADFGRDEPETLALEEHVKLLKEIERIIEDAYSSILSGSSFRPVGSRVKVLVESEDDSIGPNADCDTKEPLNDPFENIEDKFAGDSLDLTILDNWFTEDGKSIIPFFTKSCKNMSPKEMAPMLVALQKLKLLIDINGNHVRLHSVLIKNEMLTGRRQSLTAALRKYFLAADKGEELARGIDRKYYGAVLRCVIGINSFLSTCKSVS